MFACTVLLLFIPASLPPGDAVTSTGAVGFGAHLKDASRENRRAEQAAVGWGSGSGPELTQEHPALPAITAEEL